MKYKALLKKTFLEMLRDPIIYISCLCIPVLMIILFAIINHYTDGSSQMFEFEALIPGIIVFSFSFITLVYSLTISRDMKTAVLRRIYIAPIKSYHIILSYIIVGLGLAIIQEALAITSGYILSLVLHTSYFSFARASILILANIPFALIFIFLGVILGMTLSESAAPGVSSIIISLSGILGGAWMPIESMGAFFKASTFLPFYPIVYFGRLITGAKTAFGVRYIWHSSNWYYILVLITYLVLLGTISTKIIKKNQKK